MALQDVLSSGVFPIRCAFRSNTQGPLPAKGEIRDPQLRGECPQEKPWAAHSIAGLELAQVSGF